MSGGDVAGFSSPTNGEYTAGFDRPVDARTLFASGLTAAPTAERPAPAAPLGKQQLGLPASAIHELRTPLTSIHGYAQVLKRTLKAEPKSSNAVTVLNRESARLSDMLALLSELSELESDDVDGTRERLRLSEVVDTVIQDIVRRDGADHQIVVLGDARSLASGTLVAHALCHVLTNAVRYSQPGGQITVELRSAGATAEILVHDSGIGVPSQDVERVFAPFERGSNARENGVRGLGLGLYLARRSLALTDGQIEIIGGRSKGATVRISLPAA